MKTPGLLAVPLAAALLASFAGVKVHAAEPRPHLDLEVLQVPPQPAWTGAEDLVVLVHLRHAGAFDDAVPTTPFLIAPANQPWPDAVSLSVTDSRGQTLSLPWVRSGTRQTVPLRLLPDSEWTMSFFLAGDAQRVLSPGPHTLVATLAITDGPGWRGRQASGPVQIEVTAPPTTGGGMDISVAGAEALAPGDPWVVQLDLQPPLAGVTADQLRTAYTLSVRDDTGQVLAWTPDPAALPPVLPESRDLLELGLSPVLMVIPGEVTARAAPGRYHLTAQWRAGTGGPLRSAETTVRLLEPSSAESHPARRSAMLRRQFAQATALLWRAESASTTGIQTLVAEAAPILVEAERTALANYLAAPRSMETAAVVAELLWLQGDFDAARTFLRSARESWLPPRVTPEERDQLGAPTPPAELAELSQLIEEKAARPGRAWSSLRPALAQARGFDPDNLNQLAPGEGAWAVSARASSEYSPTDYGARQATGAPDVPVPGDHRRAWTPRTANAGLEWLELTYDPPFRAAGVRVIQNFNPGAIMQIEVLDETGAAQTVWTGPDTTTYPARQIGTLVASFPPTERAVARVKITLDTRRVTGYNEIDAVALIAAPPELVVPPVLTVFVDGTNPIQLSIPAWPAGFRLERASRLDPPDWSPVADEPPVLLQTNRDVEFYRLRQVP